MAKLSKLHIDNGIRFIMENGQEYVVTLDQFPDNILQELTIHGLSQKLGDTLAGAGKSKSLAEGIAQFETTLDNLQRGTWRSAQHGVLGEAISNLTGKPLSTVLAMLGKLDDKAKGKLRRDVAVKAEMLRLQQERLGESPADTENLLNSIFDEV